MASENTEEVFAAEARIRNSPPYLYWGNAGGIHHYGNYYPDDGYLRLWSGLVWDKLGNPSTAQADFVAAIHLGCDHWRVHWYLAQAAEKAGDYTGAKTALARVLKSAPDTTEAWDMHERIESRLGDQPAERFPTVCPHCNQTAYVSQPGLWQCPYCKNEFIC
jgi:tetratricopeptide (TPR) repeat protein